MVKAPAFPAGSMGLIPGQGTKVPHAAQPSQRKREKLGSLKAHTVEPWNTAVLRGSRSWDSNCGYRAKGPNSSLIRCFLLAEPKSQSKL